MLFEIRSVRHQPDLISFAWNDVGGFYNVYKDGKHLYEGDAAEFQDGDLEDGKVYQYLIERVENNQVVDVMAMQTSAFAMEKNIENPLQSLVVTAIVAKTQIALSWEEINDVVGYGIYRNGEFIGMVNTNRFIDRDIDVDQSYVYLIRSRRPIHKSGERFASMKSALSNVFGALTASRSETAIETFTTVKLIGKPKTILRPMNEREQEPESIDQWRFRYTTFLADEWVRNPNPLSPNHFFKGDGRGFDPTGEGFRTRVDIELAYDEKGEPMRFTKEVGPSIAYDHLKRFREKAKASADGITMERTDRGKGESGFILTHCIGNPLAAAPSIDYEVTADFNREGTFDMSGYFDPAPHHEIYLIKGRGDRWRSILQVESRGLAFMSDAIAYHYWRCTNFE
ncbi:DUF3238 domain-containing protein [Sporosarcina thermotolerans]|uniref:DUF3238 domain-containing protein n=1 Tax=Sporosarcina thermotolerans TaxID=633404 RepID=A0AAW9A6S0_9BACL|nr:DUF3238 domain-containing protein [Sporosarcina thermotolerans]MDW0116694.1 DUF3238 domain-containing protein [Sporosarcina thermotolerans]WHT48888.1 DUF3238 domain-containing protein [Sporosarcina thermotolerans]